MDVLQRIERGELTADVAEIKSVIELDNGSKQYISIAKPKLTAELLRLAKLGAAVEQDISKCNRRARSCFVSNCPGRKFCKAYKIPLPEPPKEGE